VEFLVDAPAVGVHGGKSNAELVGDFLEEIALRNQFENLALALGQGLHLPAGSSAFLKGLHNLPGDVAAHGRAAPVDLLERATQLGTSTAEMFRIFVAQIAQTGKVPLKLEAPADDLVDVERRNRVLRCLDDSEGW
jgi:antitoxin component of RelBE/YafQ-DinJ toxin-antitoxin module